MCNTAADLKRTKLDKRNRVTHKSLYAHHAPITLRADDGNHNTHLPLVVDQLVDKLANKQDAEASPAQALLFTHGGVANGIDSGY
jgi:hypothetical protein